MHFWRRIDKEGRIGGEGIEQEGEARESLDKSFTKRAASGARAPKVSIETGTNVEVGEYLATLRDSAYLAAVRGASGKDKREGEQG